MRWGVDAGPRLPKKKSTKGVHEGAPRALALLAVLLILTHGTWRLPPTGSTAGSALSPTPPQGGSDTGAPYASLISLPP